MNQQTNICPKECEGQQKRQQMPGSSQTHKTKQQFLWPYLQNQLEPNFHPSFSCWKWKISNIALLCFFESWWEESPQQGSEPPAPCMPVSHAQVPCTPRATVPPSATEQDRHIPHAATHTSAQKMRGAQMRPNTQKASSLLHPTASWLSVPPAPAGWKQASIKNPQQRLKLFPDWAVCWWVGAVPFITQFPAQVPIPWLLLVFFAPSHVLTEFTHLHIGQKKAAFCFFHRQGVFQHVFIV